MNQKHVAEDRYCQTSVAKKYFIRENICMSHSFSGINRFQQLRYNCFLLF